MVGGNGGGFGALLAGGSGSAEGNTVAELPSFVSDV